ncbi:MAG: hypothetical protein FD173_1907 [Gallionellaceae bacterium]|nr:MAG: hypothetical protein FD173_1907 [Gallionellaceae bacterium]
MRVTATQIADWAATKMAQADLPRLVRRLCFDAGTTRQIAFPAGDSTYSPGWDGVLYSEQGNAWVPAGASCWEMGCDKGITSKANSDYRKRTEQTTEAERLTATFVFVTPRRWSTKSKWLAGHRAKAEWGNVLAFDAEDLEQWLEQTPAVALQFAEELGLSGWGVESPVRYWQLWAQQCSPRITPEAFFIDRTQTRERLIEKINECLRQNKQHTLAVSADSLEEATAFVVAVLNGCPELVSSALVVISPEGWRFVETNRQLRIAIAARTEIAVTPTLRDGLLVIVPHAVGDVSGKPQGDEIVLERPKIYDFEKALVSIGMEESDANRYALATGRSWSVLRRQRAINPAIRRPAWLAAPEATSLATLCLLGAWSENKEADRLLVSQLADKPYEEIERDLRELSQLDDSPVLKIGSVWKAKSPLELLDLFGGRITRDQLDRFFRIAQEILSAPDPQLELPSSERYAAQVHGKIRSYSDLLIESLCDALIKLAVRGTEQSSLQALQVEQRVSLLIRDLLEAADGERWLSLASCLPALAEAAPDSFLRAIEKSLMTPDAPVTRLITETDASGSLSGRCWHSGLLWALETLAWRPKWLARVALVLAHLCHVPIKGNWGNSPNNSLFGLFRTWLPQTAADVQQRIKVLDLLIAREPEVAFSILEGLVRNGPQMATLAARPKWGDDDAGAGRAVTHEEYWQMHQAAIERLIQCSTGDAQHIAKLFEHTDLRDGQELSKVLALVEPFTQTSAADVDREAIRASLRRKIHWHRNYDETQSADLDELLSAIESLYDRLEPVDLLLRHRWLFANHWPDLPVRTRDEDIGARGGLQMASRNSALIEIFQVLGMDGIERLIRECRDAGVVGAALAATECGKVKWAKWIAEMGNEFTPSEPITFCISGLLCWLQQANSTMLIREVLAQADTRMWSAERRARFLVLARSEQASWEQATACGDETEQAYWSMVNPGHLRSEDSNIDFVLRKLLGAKRPRTALRCCQYDLKQVDAKLLFEMLQRFMQGEEPQGMLLDSWHLGEMLTHLEKSGEIEKSALIQLEFGLFPALRYGQESCAALLYDSIMTEPALFAELIRILYKPEHSEWEEPVTDAHRDAAGTAWSILHGCARQPGTGGDGTVDHDAFKQFINDARELCRQADRLDMCDQTLGQVLAHAPSDENGLWPFAPAREVLEPIEMEEMRKGFHVGARNKRGVTSRGMWDGGGQERDLAAHYRSHAEKLHLTQPNVADLLDKIARSYEHDGKREDTEANLRKEGY